ncbi:MAG: biotin carboxylase N-terminal domain-containing protein [Bacteroidales bacterium]
MQQIKKVLVANRGEIAVRILKTLREMGVASVAIYSDADARSVHARRADESFRMTGSGLAETYLDAGQIIKLAKQSGADAIHPGYGFLSESAVFSAAVREAGLHFIGPGTEAIRLMGNKSGARKLVAGMGIPIIEGATGKAKVLGKKASEIGYPVLVKAAGGGGGKGMRIVHSSGQLDEVLETTQREALNYFGNDEVYIEKYLENPRHVEVQLLADFHGHVVSLFERECSIQRRYQKIIEESPSPTINNHLRKKLMEAAKAIAAKIAYTSAGTIEFLVVGDDFYFLEMNTRIQVEHPVTEMVTGIDIVREQLNISMGKPLAFAQEDLRMQGHAIEARVYAEDPARNFIPSPGKIIHYQEPVMPGLRIDTAMESGAMVSSEFDPMISKVISHASTRKEALEKLQQGLSGYSVHGIRTNLSFLSAVLRSEAFKKGNTDTGFCDRLMLNGHEPPSDENDEILLAAFLFASRENGPGKPGIWNQLGYWRLLMSPELLINERVVKRRLVSRNRLLFQMERQGKLENYRLLKKEQHDLVLEAAGEVHQLRYTPAADHSVWIQKGPDTFRVRYAQRIEDRELIGMGHNPVSSGNSVVKAPMHGKVVKLNVRESDVVDRGDTLLILESMKMENRIVATARGRIKSIAVEPGMFVADNAPLVYLSDVS